MNVEVAPRPRHYVDTAPFDPGGSEPVGAESEQFYRVFPPGRSAGPVGELSSR